MFLAALSLWLPRGWSDNLKHVMQLITPGQAVVSRGVAQGAARLNERATRDPDAALRQEVESLRNALVSQRALVEQIGAENRRLKALRDGQVPLPVPLLPAKVTGRDILAWRDVALVDRGSVKSVSLRDWVATRLFVDQGRTAGVEPGAAVSTREVDLGREYLLGRVEEVSPYVSRVQLFSDVDSNPIEVRVGGIAAGNDTTPYACSLRGLGNGRMVIKDVPERYVQTEGSTAPLEGERRMRVGDYVFSAPGQLGLPVPMLIGRVSEIQVNPKQRLVLDVMVEPLIDRDAIREVMIVPLVPAGLVPTAASP